MGRRKLDLPSSLTAVAGDGLLAYKRSIRVDTDVTGGHRCLELCLHSVGVRLIVKY